MSVTPWERRLARAAALVALGFGLAAPAAAQTIYGWRTEDGAYAYTDDPKAIPARYKGQAKPQAAAPLQDYARFTQEDSAAAERYAKRLATRLEHLRALNAPTATQATVASTGSLTAGATTVSLQLGGENAPKLGLAVRADAGPVVVEKVLTRPRGKSHVRHSIVVRQGGRTLAVVKSRSRQTNLSTDIYDERDLER